MEDYNIKSPIGRRVGTIKGKLIIGKEQSKIDYQDVMDLGFKRVDSECPIHLKTHGWEDFDIELKVSKRLKLEWDNETRFVRAYKYDKDHTITGTYKIADLQDLKDFIALYKS